jgi:nickel transport protein
MTAKALPELLCWLLITASAHAHKVNVFAWAEGDTVYTESKFSGGKVVKGGKISVLDADGAVLLEGATDNEGAFSFKAPKIADLTIVMDAGTGHRNSWKITAAELGGDAPAMSGAGAPAPSGGVTPPVAPGLSAREVEEIVARQLEEKLRPLNRMMAESRDRGATLPDIVGGVGYILGLIGLGAYIRYRKGRGKP